MQLFTSIDPDRQERPRRLVSANEAMTRICNGMSVRWNERLVIGDDAAALNRCFALGLHQSWPCIQHDGYINVTAPHETPQAAISLWERGIADSAEPVEKRRVRTL